MNDPLSQILVIRFSSLGDVVLASAALRGIGRAMPHAKITFATKLAYQPLFDHFDVPIEVTPYRPGQSLLSYRHRLSGVRYDCIIDLHGSMRAALLSRSLRARKRVRVRKYVALRRAMVRHKVGLDHPLSAMQAYLDTLKSLGLTVEEPFPKLCLSVEETERVKALRAVSPTCIGIGWGARWPTKVVPTHVWEAVLGKLNEGRSDGVRLFGRDSDRPEMESFAERERAKRPSLQVQIESGLPLRDVMIKIASCTVFVGSDSGLMHVASALGVPSFGLFGPTHPALGFGPVGPGARAFHGGTWCSPCHRHGAAPCFRERRFCFDDLDPAQIAAAITSVITEEACGHGAHG